MHPVIVSNLVKKYSNNSTVAVKDVSFSVGEGELFGLIGPDGAGKTSIFRVLTTLLLPDGGSVTVNGLDVVNDYESIRSSIGYMPGRFSLYQDLTVEENLSFFATLFGTTIQENYHLIKDIYVQIEPFKDRRAGKLSGGMKQKLALCCALIHNPTVLFLDEPTTGVDAVSRKEFWEMLKRLKEQGITILVSTPYMDEATLCDRIALIQDGCILSIESSEKIIETYGDQLYALKSDNMHALLLYLQSHSKVKSCFTFGEYLHMTLVGEVSINLAGLIEQLRNNGFAYVEVKKITPTIEDCFIKLMNPHEHVA
jgi:ABC-type multidrug transport system ATPase subunit